MAYDSETNETRLRSLTVARLLETADYLESLPPENFDMGEWLTKDPECGTVACIAGHIAVRNNPRRYLYPSDAPNLAQRWLGIDDNQATDLFMPKIINYIKITTSDAATTLRKLAFTGKVDWSHVED